jgi:glutathione S-transferase
MCRYIALKTKSSLIPPTFDIHVITKFEQAITLEALNFDQFAYALYAEQTWSKIAYGRPCNEARVQELTKALQERLVGYERILSRQRYLAGENVTLADLFHLPYGTKLVGLGHSWFEDMERLPNLAM